MHCGEPRNENSKARLTETTEAYVIGYVAGSDRESATPLGEVYRVAMLIDTHAHIQMREFDADRAEALARATAAGVGLMLAVGYHLEASRMAVEAAQRFPQVYAAVGIHPHDAGTYDDAAEETLRDLAKQPKVVAIGEAGLDFFRDRAPRAVQADAFRRQIRLARELDLPLIVHDRDAHEDTMELLQEKAAPRVLLHCFSGDLTMAEEAWRRGYYTSIAGPVTYPKNETLREIVRKAKTDRLLLETDCPFLPPQAFRGQRNEPAYLLHTAQEVARVLGIRLDELGHLTTDNARRLFRLPASE
ncbi:deoxyribonuclease (ycfH) [Candidatus Methylomirabilis lanthanidiphila]|uniref:Deoxyribonuclease (YcfH) n=1 Tax=Candidatus Methylomirabilis lanthanidiphila TaxID=2211376 RepID=A0A564ZES5_9BACT|nr:deoxyribonuclease (ycfH) [Candidatus Methylomirabilis lanthanidiphila]